MTELQFMAMAGPLMLYIFGVIAVVMTIFFYLELKEKRSKFKNYHVQQREIDRLKKENQDLKDSVVAKIRSDLKVSNIG